MVLHLGNRKMSLLLIVFSSLKASGVGDVPVRVRVHVAGPDLSWRLVLNHTNQLWS